MTDRNFTTDCQVTIALSTVTAFGVMGFGAVFGWRDYIRAGLLSGLVVLVAIAWTIAYPRLKYPHVQLREALWKIEQATNLDIDQNGVVGEPQPQRPIVISGKVRKPTAFEDDLAYFVREFMNGRCSWREWNGRKAGWTKAAFPSGREVEQVYWERMNKILLEAKVANRNGLGTLKPLMGMTLGKAHRLAFDTLRNSPTLAQVAQ